MSAMTGYKQYGRKYRIVVNSKKGGSIDVSNLRCIFHVEKTLDDTPGYSQISIYNLKQSTVRSIAPGDTVIVEAGYEKGNYGMIFSGDVVQPLTTLEEGVDYVLTLICQDGDKFLTSAFVMQTLEKKTPFSGIVEACTKGVTTNLITDEIDKKGQLIRGKGWEGQYRRRQGLRRKNGCRAQFGYRPRRHTEPDRRRRFLHLPYQSIYQAQYAGEHRCEPGGAEENLQR